MHRALFACLLGLMFIVTEPLAAEPPPAALASAATSKYPCDDPTCGLPSLLRVPTYSQKIARDGDFTAELTIEQPCSCARRLSALMTFTALGGRAGRERKHQARCRAGHPPRKLTFSNAD